MRLFFCGVFLYSILCCVFGAKCFEYCLWAITGKDAPFIIDLICCFFTSGLTVPGAIVLYLLSSVLEYPLL